MTMNEENNMEKEVKELLDTLKEYGRDQRQKKQIDDLIDSLAAKETQRKTIPLWLKTAIGISACALLFFVLKIAQNPSETESMEMAHSVLPQDEEIVLDSVAIPKETLIENVEKHDVERLGAERKTVVAQNVVEQIERKIDADTKQEMAEIVENQEFVQIDTSLVAQPALVYEDSIQIADTQPEPAKRRVVRAENLVAYDDVATKHKNRRKKSRINESGAIGLPQYSASEGCMLAFEINTELND